MGDARQRKTWVVWLLRALVVVVLLLVVNWIVSNIDWDEVGQAFRAVSNAQLALLVALVVLRYAFSATPLSMLIPGLGLGRAMVSDLTAVTMATAAPPPADVVVRFGMFRAWGINLARAGSGLALNTVLFYVIRFSAPLFGVLAFVTLRREDTGLGWFPYLSGLLAVAIAGGMALMVRSEAGARWIGHSAGRIVGRVTPDRADPDRWADAMAEFRTQVAEDLSSKWLGASTALVFMLATEATMFLVAVRAAGVSEAELSWLFVVGAFCVVYPATSLPASGLGVLDAALFTLLNRETGGNYESQLIAAIVIWRALTMVMPIILGGLTLLLFRRTHDMSADDEEIVEAAGRG